MVQTVSGLLSAAVFTALAFGGVARADIIIQNTITGPITSIVINNPGGLESVFGGGIADGVSLTLSFTYDLTLIDAAIADAKGSYTSNATSQDYVDVSGDSAVSESLTINSKTFTVSNNLGAEGIVIYSTHFFFPSSLSIDVAAGGGQLGSDLYSNLPFELDQANSQAGVDAFLQQLQQAGTVGVFGTNIVLDVAGYGPVASINADLAPSPVPEPSAWLMLAVELCGLALYWMCRAQHRGR